ncbi:MAG: DUF512 domain-containing protein [Bacillota bacterium]|nr:DUF512 domain-containing protein [Bacillota bacterium]
MAVKITDVIKNSSADKCGIKAGETLISIDNHDIIDVLDYRFYQLNTSLSLIIRDLSGNTREVRITKQEYDEIGLDFETYLMDKQRPCKNKCIFCFIDQLPKGLRKSLYFKDDDSRLSFLFGNYITLTNLTEHEIDRIIKMHISPINVSVHTTNPELRCKMMGNRFAGKTLEVLERFAKANIKINCQIVSCRGINDGEELKRTLSDLEKLLPSLESVAVVPVGLTKFRENLFELQPYDMQSAAETVEIIESFGNRYIKEHGRRIVFAADEFYIKANKTIPSAEFYESFDQLENGIGMIALLKDEFLCALEDLNEDSDIQCKVTIACGVSAAPYMQELMNEFQKKYKNIIVQVIPIVNDFFGDKIDVTGLIVGGDLINQLKNVDLGEELFISSNMLRHEGDLFLDDTSLCDVENALNIKVTPIKNDGAELLENLLRRGTHG